MKYLITAGILVFDGVQILTRYLTMSKHVIFIYSLQSDQTLLSEKRRLPDRRRCLPVQTDPELFLRLQSRRTEYGLLLL